ncbi:MAG: M23 family metallopeptidase [Ignavibacteria bacterium]|nr:M23 family metallopeptidase [Ignavibacteria bacterium]MBI3765463.1 M23 family metallopeptidase [Ignavibacteriales bacterium]
MRTNLQDYNWPTDASTKVTSSFAEYRSTHFHGGIDISTNGQKGYKVFAVRDGYIYRIRITPTGYGKMLFVKHADGYVSTYAHLQTFSQEINRVARAEQYRRETYSIDLTLDSSIVPVRQGDVIAYTGDTGFGPPHLHFEIRDESLNPINPMLCTKFGARDDIPPRIRRVMISPLTYNSSVENNTGPRYFSRFPRSKRVLTIPQTIRVHGQVGFAVEADDKSDGTASRAGIHRMEFYLDDSLIYSMELNRVPAEESKQIDLHYDLPAINEGRGEFQKLYIDAGNTLPFYEHKPPGTGIINTEKITEGKHTYRIVCLDIRGNRSELNGTLLANHRPVIHLDHVDDDGIVLTGDHLESIAKCYVFGKRAFQPSWSQHTLTRDRMETDSSGMEMPVNTKPYDVIKVVAETKWGSQSAPVFYFIKKSQGPVRDVHIATEVLKDHVKFTITTPGVFTTTPSLSVQEGMNKLSVTLEAIDVDKYSGMFVPSDQNADRRLVQVSAEVNGKPTSAVDSFSLIAIPAGRGGSITIDHGNLDISYDSAAVYKPLCMEINSETNRGSTFYSLEPSDVLLNRGITVSMRVKSESDISHQGLYFGSRGAWVFQTGLLDKNHQTFSTTLNRTLGDLAILRDDERPTLGRLRVQTRKGFLFISFRYHDNLSGVDPDEIKLYLDNKLLIPEIDGEHHLAWYQGDEPLHRGKHSVTITLKDHAGNETGFERTLTVK